MFFASVGNIVQVNPAEASHANSAVRAEITPASIVAEPKDLNLKAGFSIIPTGLGRNLPASLLRRGKVSSGNIPTPTQPKKTYLIVAIIFICASSASVAFLEVSHGSL